MFLKDVNISSPILEDSYLLIFRVKLCSAEEHYKERALCDVNLGKCISKLYYQLKEGKCKIQ